MEWQPIETAPIGAVLLFWVVPKTKDEAFVGTSGQSIFTTFKPSTRMVKHGEWSSLSKATHWMPLPAPPAVDAVDPYGEAPADGASTREKRSADHEVI